MYSDIKMMSSDTKDVYIFVGYGMFYLLLPLYSLLKGELFGSLILLIIGLIIVGIPLIVYLLTGDTEIRCEE